MPPILVSHGLGAQNLQSISALDLANQNRTCLIAVVKQSPDTSITVDGICGHACTCMQLFYPVASRGNKDKNDWVAKILANDMQFTEFCAIW